MSSARSISPAANSAAANGNACRSSTTRGTRATCGSGISARPAPRTANRVRRVPRKASRTASTLLPSSAAIWHAAFPLARIRSALARQSAGVCMDEPPSRRRNASLTPADRAAYQIGRIVPRLSRVPQPGAVFILQGGLGLMTRRRNRFWPAHRAEHVPDRRQAAPELGRDSLRIVPLGAHPTRVRMPSDRSFHAAATRPAHASLQC